ncbi:DNA-3-methyladenine glycosylase family protein [Metabacillus sediminilitoris]|uniref:DNA-3-methyladenine glycosylase II n=1 Tax=Metabacillus sediminilitoris TaxID=2567941 RepID=A0A4S4BYH4_9BACI|nr:DNA-3-methyladenine glycosylase [Metabacillus sediminilitoris]QGQ44251.1 DNA-3-methyladenine glycosylase 2 family protein [Metabacillus sediminilitoris]THF78214.1 DNA-3-methyladenine glycosylase 2 family protein [Metabacillus sediminilitoris]
MWKEIIATAGPYHFDRVLDRLSIDPVNFLHLEEKFVKVPLVIEEMPYVIRVKAVGSTADPLFEVSGNDEKVKEQAIKEVKRIFQFDFPLQTLSLHFEKTNIAEIFQQHAGTPLVLEFDLYRCLIKCIIHQQLNLAFAHTLTERFVTNFGYQVEDVWFYPKPETVAALKYDDLRALQFSGRKAEYVIDTSRLIAEGTLNLAELKMMSDEEIMKKLIKVRGIGPWTVQNLLLAGLGRPNLFPKADIGVQKAIQKHFKLEKKPTSEEMDEYSLQWAPYLSYATLYFWRSIE